MLSVVIPAYNEEEMIAKTANVIEGILAEAQIEYELIFVDDGSKDNTWKIIRELADGEPNIRGIQFSRNFGKESAIYAGLQKAAGDCAVVMDCDLQHPPQKIVEMYELWKEGYEVVEAVKSDRGKESLVHSMGAKCFYKIISNATKIDMSRASDFKLLDRKAILAILNMNEKHAFFRALSAWIGFKTTQIEFEVHKREAGKTKWSRAELTKYAITNVSSFTTVPMQIVTILGVIMFIATIVLGFTAIYQKVVGIALDGFTTVILLELFIGSMVMLSLGIIGYYIARIYEEIKDRPRFIVTEECGADK